MMAHDSQPYEIAEARDLSLVLNSRPPVLLQLRVHAEMVR
jgi:hypothetical protein